MENTQFRNNSVTVIGKIVSNFKYNHSVYGESFYLVDLSVNRLSEQVDTIPLMVSERLIDVTKNYKGCTIEVSGQLRSYNRYEEDKNRLLLYVFMQGVEFWDGSIDAVENNCIDLNGYICKEPTYRKTPLGREIADLLLAVNRPYGKSDYIPCIAWGRNALFTSNLKVGTNIMICGRLQSREYTKKISDNETEIRTAYEVSISKIVSV